MYNKITITSVLDSELLASAQNQNLQRQEFGLPCYINDQELKDFIDKTYPMVNTDVGYMFITLEKDYYLPGEIVRGSVFFELFRICYQTKLLLAFEGIEQIPKRYEKVQSVRGGPPDFNK